MVEEWRPVAGMEGCYEVSDTGRVRSVPRESVHLRLGKKRHRRLPGQEMAVYQVASGHIRTTLHRGGRKHVVAVHRLVLEAFVGPCPEGMEGCHNNGNPADNRLGNLRWGTRRDNVLDQVAHGVHPMARRVECKNGHPFDEANTRVDPRSGKRACRACKAAHSGKRRAAARAARALREAA